MHPIRAFASLAAAVLVCAVALPTLSSLPFDSGSAYAESKAKKKQTKGKEIPKGLPARTPFTQEEQAAATIPNIPDARVWGDSAAEFKRVLPTISGPWLSMSGGGADGSFAAGLLTGWTESGKRPEFSVVTGASIGALISPYAFLGPRYDAELRDSIITITAADTPQLVAEVAAEHRRGRRLLAITTNVDAGRRVIWNMGAIAERGDDKAIKLFRDVLLASASIPGFFPPVFIDVEANGRRFQEMHLDGSITSPFFVAPESLLGGGSNTPLPATELYIVANSRLAPDFAPPERNTVAILGRLIGVVLKAGLRAELLIVAGNAQRLGVNVKVAQVSETFQQPARGLFDHVYMQALFNYGVEQAAKGTAFESVTTASIELRGDDPQ